MTCLSFRAIIDLAQKFDVVACQTTVTELDLNHKYRILRAKRLTTRFCPTVVLNIRGEGAAPPKYSCLGYSDVITGTNIEQINSNAVFLHLVYKEVCSTTKAYL